MVFVETGKNPSKGLKLRQRQSVGLRQIRRNRQESLEGGETALYKHLVMKLFVSCASRSEKWLTRTRTVYIILLIIMLGIRWCDYNCKVMRKRVPRRMKMPFMAIYDMMSKRVSRSALIF